MIITIICILVYYAIVVLLIVKTIEILIDIHWDFKHGTLFADEILWAMPNIENRTQWNQTWAELEEKHNRHEYILLNLLKKASKSPNSIKKKSAILVRKYVFRESILIWEISLLIPAIYLFRSYIWTYRLFLIISICILLISLVVQTTALIINRIKMGAVDNFHKSILSRIDTFGAPEFMPSQRLILENFYIIFLRNLGGVIIGFTGIYCAIYLLDLSSFIGIINSSCPFNIWAQFLYFSVVTLTTTGFGDIHVINLSLRLIVTLEIGIGLMYIVVLLHAFSLTNSYKKT